jgi:hypothetical protein
MIAHMSKMWGCGELPVMLVQVGATSPSLRPAPMTKLDLLLQQAEVSARSALIGTRERLRPLFHMIHANGQESLTGVPWRDDGEKETTLALVRARYRQVERTPGRGRAIF